MSEFELSRKEAEEIDAKVGRIHSQFTAIENEMTELLERVKELEHQAMDGRTLAVLVAMAKGYLPADDFGSQCAYCYVSEWECRPSGGFEYIDADLPHKPDCPINVARILLKERGTPANVYKMCSEYCNNPKKKNAVWTQAGGEYIIALAPDDAIKECVCESRRNIRAEFVREVPCRGRGI